MAKKAKRRGRPPGSKNKNKSVKGLTKNSQKWKSASSAPTSTISKAC